jgi:hypothetical protein
MTDEILLNLLNGTDELLKLERGCSSGENLIPGITMQEFKDKIRDRLPD